MNMDDMLESMSKAHKAKISAAMKGKKKSESTKKKISAAMKGHSNFEGKHHDRGTKRELKQERGHDDRVEGRRWRTEKHTGEESRVYKKGDGKKYRWGRALGEWLEGQYSDVEENHGGSDTYFYVTFVNGKKYAVLELYAEDTGWFELQVAGNVRLDDVGGKRFDRDVSIDTILEWEAKDQPEYKVEGPFRTLQRAEDYIGVPSRAGQGNVTEDDGMTEEYFYITIVDPDSDEWAIAEIFSDERYWHEKVVAGNAPSDFGNARYMGYLSDEEVLSWIQGDYKYYEVDGAFESEEEAKQFLSMHHGITEGQLTELSSELLRQYKSKAAVDSRDADRKGDFKKANKRFRGVVKATVKQFNNDAK